MSNTVYDLWCLAYAVPRLGETDITLVSILPGEDETQVLVTSGDGAYSWSGHKSVWTSALRESLNRSQHLDRYSDKIGQHSDKIGQHERAARFEVGDWNPPESFDTCFVFDPEEDEVVYK